jgi:hypothetical protein
LVGFLHSNISVLKSKASWEIFIQNCDLGDCIISI